MITGRRIILLLMMMSLTGCSYFMNGISVKVETDCIWFKDQQFSDETKAWLAREPWPDHVREDFDKVADNNDLAKEYCQ